MWGCSLLSFSPHNDHECFPRKSAFRQGCRSSPGGHVVVLRFLCHTCKAWPGLGIYNFNYSPRFVQVCIATDGGGFCLHFTTGVDIALDSANPIIEKCTVLILICISVIIICVMASHLSCAMCKYHSEQCQYILWPSLFYSWSFFLQTTTTKTHLQTIHNLLKPVICQISTFK